MTTPFRTCVGCKNREPKNRLIRLVLVGNRVVPESTEAKSGRGVYLHQSLDCINNAITRKAIARGLNVRGDLDLSEIANLVQQNK